SRALDRIPRIQVVVVAAFLEHFRETVDGRVVVQVRQSARGRRGAFRIRRVVDGRVHPAAEVDGRALVLRDVLAVASDVQADVRAGAFENLLLAVNRRRHAIDVAVSTSAHGYLLESVSKRGSLDVSDANSASRSLP